MNANNNINVNARTDMDVSTYGMNTCQNINIKETKISK